jgi:hypothetical protein
MTIKISVFPDATTPMAAADRVTGLQGGANVNFSQAQILTGAAGVGADGANITVQGGLGPTDHNGGTASLYGGYSTGSGNGGGLNLISGAAGGTGAGGNVTLAANYSNSGAGGGVNILSGSGSPPGDMTIKSRGNLNCGSIGNAVFYAADLRIQASGTTYMYTLPTSDPSKSQAVWDNHGFLVHSGIGNFNGTTTVADIGTKTLTFANGILVSIA